MPARPRNRILTYDRHGDVVDDLADHCGADVVPGDLAFNRLLAASPVRR